MLVGTGLGTVKATGAATATIARHGLAQGTVKILGVVSDIVTVVDALIGPPLTGIEKTDDFAPYENNTKAHVESQKQSAQKESAKSYEYNRQKNSIIIKRK